MKELKNFDLISYLVYLNKELTEQEREQKIVIESTHNRLRNKFTSQHVFTGFKKMQLQIDKDSKLEGEGALAFTKDKEGKNIIKLIRQGNIDKSENEFAINARKFYMHYPYNPPRVSCFGYGYNYKLGNNECYSTTSAPIIMQRLEKPVKKLVQRSTYTICLTDDNMLYRCGYKVNFKIV